MRSGKAVEHAVPEQIKNSVAKRRHEFIVGRHCAAMALRCFGEHRVVGVRPDRSPIWPTNFCGSISHSNQLAWSVVANKDTASSIGVDVQEIVDTATVAETNSQILTATERDLLAVAGYDAFVAYTLAFSAKESVYKCLFPLGVTDLEFLQLTIDRVSHDQLSINFNTLPQQPAIAVNFALAHDHAFTFCYRQPEPSTTNDD